MRSMADEIIPRWEWRTFADDFGKAEEMIRASGEARVRESEEVYLFSSDSNDNAKIRFELMDIKTLNKINPQGLEQWYPAFKGRFPLERADMGRVLEAWRVPEPSDLDENYTLERFLAEIVDPHEKLFRVDVRKERHGYLMDDCIVEIAEVHFDGEPQRTMAVEMEDPDKVWKLVNKLGLADRENINYLKAMKRFKQVVE